MKLIFLDCDGVLAPQDNSDSLYNQRLANIDLNKVLITKQDYASFEDGVYKD